MDFWPFKKNDDNDDNNYEVRMFGNYDVNIMGKLMFGNTDEQNKVEKEILNMIDGSDDAWLSVMEECFYLVITPKYELNLLQFLKYIPRPQNPETLIRFIQRIHQMVHFSNQSNALKYNILIVLLKLGYDACKNIQENKIKNIETETKSQYKLILNNRTINAVWKLLHCSDVRVKVLALAVLHLYIENYESLQPPAIEDLLRNYLHSSLILNYNSEIQFLTRYIAKHTFQNPIVARSQTLEEERVRIEKETGKGKIYIEDHPNLLFDDDGLTVRNNTLIVQCCYLSPHVLSNVPSMSGNWYWEVTVCSPRYIKAGYCKEGGNLVEGCQLNVSGLNDTFGFLLNFDKRVFTVYSKAGVVQEMKLKDNFKFSPSFELGPLQQITCNFGKPTLSKQSSNLLSEVKCASGFFRHSPSSTFRQQCTLIFLHQEYQLELDKEKDKNRAVFDKYQDKDKEKELTSSPSRRKKNNNDSVSPSSSFKSSKANKKETSHSSKPRKLKAFKSDGSIPPLNGSEEDESPSPLMSSSLAYSTPIIDEDRASKTARSHTPLTSSLNENNMDDYRVKTARSERTSAAKLRKKTFKKKGKGTNESNIFNKENKTTV